MSPTVAYNVLFQFPTNPLGKFIFILHCDLWNTSIDYVIESVKKIDKRIKQLKNGAITFFIFL